MGRQLNMRPAGRHPLLALLALLGAIAAAPAARAADAGAAAPQYDITPCCSLCPRAQDTTMYDGTTSLGDFRVLAQGRDGWLFRTGLDLTTHIDINDQSIEQLRRLAASMRERGTEIVIVLQPPRGLMDPDKLTPALRSQYDFAAAKRAYAQALARIRLAGVTVAPLDRLVDEHKGYEYFFRRDHHWTPEGAEHTAQVVADTVRRMPAFRTIPRKTFVTHTGNLIAKPGTLQKLATQICGGVYSMQYVTGYTTEPADGGTGGNDASALLGSDASAKPSGAGHAPDGDAGGLLGGGAKDGDVPQIVLVGTSNSDTKGGYNFDGYLEQELGADILNTAVTGGAFDGSLLHYLPSALYQQHPPKVLIWEMPWQDWPSSAIDHHVKPYKTFRQAVPLVHDGCVGRPAVLSQTVQLQRGSNLLLLNGSGGQVRNLTGSHYWLDMQFDDPAVKDVHAFIWYFTGQKESLKLHFKQYVDNGGRFVSELRSDRDDYAKATFMGALLQLDQSPAKPLKVGVRLCEAVPLQRTLAVEAAHDQAAH